MMPKVTYKLPKLQPGTLWIIVECFSGKVSGHYDYEFSPENLDDLVVGYWE